MNRWHQLVRWAERVHLAVWLYSAGASAIGYLQGIPAFWILVLVPISMASLILVQLAWFETVGWWPLPEAAGRAYRALEGTAFLEGSRSRGDPETRLDKMADALSDYAPIWGTRPPGAPTEISALARAAGNFHAGATEFRMEGNPKPSYVALKMRRGDLRRAIKKMKAEAGAK